MRSTSAKPRSTRRDARSPSVPTVPIKAPRAFATVPSSRRYRRSSNRRSRAWRRQFALANLACRARTVVEARLVFGIARRSFGVRGAGRAATSDRAPKAVRLPSRLMCAERLAVCRAGTGRASPTRWRLRRAKRLARCVANGDVAAGLVARFSKGITLAPDRFFR